VRILVLYFKWKKYRDRNTIDEHLFCFRRYVKDVQYHYFNAANGIPWYLTMVNYDAVILHYTFLAIRWREDLYKEWLKTVKSLKKISGYIVAIPQDEYAEAAALYEFFREYGIRTVFTCFSSNDYDTVYPNERVKLDKKITVFPGYIDEEAAKRLSSRYGENNDRPIDLGYRARKLPYWLGRHGQFKYEIGNVFAKRMKNSGLKVDISTDEKDVFPGSSWYDFLGRCRAVLGCEGGASLFDPTGKIRMKVEAYIKNHPDASFKEVEEYCFPSQDYNIRLFTLSPRHFECAITKTCQILLEGDYGGIFSPGIHYIELKKDYSNIDQVIEHLRDAEYCKQIAENAYRDIIESKRYTYRVFANQVIDHISNKVGKVGFGARKKEQEKPYFDLLKKYLFLREFVEPILVKVFYVWFGFRLFKTRIIKRTLGKLN
jgi:hypothetical protein